RLAVGEDATHVGFHQEAMEERFQEQSTNRVVDDVGDGGAAVLRRKPVFMVPVAVWAPDLDVHEAVGGRPDG
ncbi:MAG: hypothetical protein ACYST0_12325, partial [Planctomycetota bacterium]